MFVKRNTLVGFATVVLFLAMAAGAVLAADERERQLIDILRSDSPRATKAITCKRLAVYGTKDAVPALAELLADKELSSWALIALEVIPGPEADRALREAMGRLEGRELVGVINSIGVRRDAGAVEGLATRLGDADPDVATAAAGAVGHIGGEPATRILREALRNSPVPVRSAVAEACILRAERCLEEGKLEKAAEIYDQVRKADVSKQRIVEATRGAILARGSEGIPLLVEQLRSNDKARFAMGLQTARELDGGDVSRAIAAEVPRATPARSVLLVHVLTDRGDKAVLLVVLETAKRGPREARIAALGMLRRLGDESCVPTLLEVGGDSDRELAEAALAALEGLSGEKVDAILVAQLPQAKGPTRKVLIEAVGRRRIEAATAALKAATDEADPQIRLAALKALGETAGSGDLAFLIERVTSSKHAEDALTARQALRAACVRMPQREATAEALTGAMAGAPASARGAILETLGAMGGTRALATIAASASGDDPALRDTASRLLGQWMTIDAAPVLLDLAKTSPEANYQVRAIRGYIRLVRQFNMPAPQRSAMCRRAMLAARRPAEKKLVLRVMERYPSVDMLKLAAGASKDPEVGDEAVRTALVIGQKVATKPEKLRTLLAEIGQTPVEVEILKAEYGAGSTLKDVTATLRRYVVGLPIIVLPTNRYNTDLGGDPVPNMVKQLKIRYRINGKPGEAVFAENAPIVLPIPE